jgi:uncharacterized protein (TIGR03435 family)
VNFAKKAALAIIVVAMLTVPLTAQSFEVASIKPNTTPASDRIKSSIRQLPGGLTAQRASLQSLIQWAYGVEKFQVAGGPDWLDSTWFDIQAKTDGTASSKDDLMRMLQALLTERLKLAVHREAREIAGVSLMASKGGSKLQAVAPGDKLHGQVQFAMAGKAMQLTGVKAPMSELTLWLRSYQPNGGPVFDQTGLSGTYDFKLEWTPGDDSPGALEAALRQQLGLTLTPARVRTEVVVVDHVEKVPSPN